MTHDPSDPSNFGDPLEPLTHAPLTNCQLCDIVKNSALKFQKSFDVGRHRVEKTHNVDSGENRDVCWFFHKCSDNAHLVQILPTYELLRIWSTTYLYIQGENIQERLGLDPLQRYISDLNH